MAYARRAYAREGRPCSTADAEGARQPEARFLLIVQGGTWRALDAPMSEGDAAHAVARHLALDTGPRADECEWPRRLPDVTVEGGGVHACLTTPAPCQMVPGRV